MSTPADSPPPYPQTPAGPVPHRPPSGMQSWAVGLVVLACLPFLGSVLAGAGMAVSGVLQRSSGGLARANGTGAANWGITYLAATVLLVGGHFFALYMVDTRDLEMSGWFLIPLGLWALVSVLHVVTAIRGMLHAGRGEAFRAPGALPLLRD